MGGWGGVLGVGAWQCLGRGVVCGKAWKWVIACSVGGAERSECS